MCYYHKIIMEVQEQIPVAPPRMDGSNVPDLIKVGAIQTNMSMDVHSDVLDPIVCNQSNARFVFQNKGYLSEGSRITLACEGNASVALGAFFPVNVGVHSLIRRATLSVGGQTVCEIDDYNHFKAFESMFLSSEINRDREAYMSGRLLAHDFRYNASTNADGNSNTKANDYGLVTNVEYDGGGLVQEPPLEVNNKPVFSVTLGELFPFMKGTNLPLFAMKQEVIIDLVWEPAGDGRVSISDNSTEGSAIQIITNEVKLVADYIFYDGEIMSQQLNSMMGKSTTFAYNDYRLTKTSLSVANASNSVRNLGGAGRLVTKVISFLNDDNRDAKNMTNKYGAVAPSRDYANPTKFNSTLTTNIRMNDFFVFPIDLSNSAVLFDKTSRAVGSVPFVTREEYSGEGNTLTSATFEALAQNASVGLGSNFFFQAYKLPAGRVNARGLELTTKFSGLPALDGDNTYTQRSYIEVKRIAVLENGFLTAGFA